MEKKNNFLMIKLIPSKNFRDIKGEFKMRVNENIQFLQILAVLKKKLYMTEESALYLSYNRKILKPEKKVSSLKITEEQ